jgi:molybdenum cofactor guanylyltransferase
VDKLTARIEGATLLERSVAAVASVADDVVVVLAPGRPSDEVPARARVANDATEGQGPLAGLAAGIASVTGSEIALVVGGDMPELQPAVLRAIVAAMASSTSVELAALDDGGRARPLPMAVRTKPAAAAARRLLDRGDRRLRSLFDELRVRTLDEPTWRALDPERRTLRDVDEPGDLTR